MTTYKGHRPVWLLALFALGRSPMPAWSDEGMWLLNEPPVERLKEKYGFDLTAGWLEHVRLASIRFNNGGSGAFVSPDGLIITNHHIGADALQKLSAPDRDLLRDGFYAPNRAEERKCPDLELNVLQEIVDVTDRVNAAVKEGQSPAEAAAARRGTMSAIEKESLDQTGWRSDVVTLYQGGAYHLYRYKKYTDVRLVMAPEQQVAFFGGDTDNFEFPRYNLDVCFFRAYEDGKPARVRHFLRFSPTGPRDGDLVFVTGNPGTTNRLETSDKLRHRRDVTLPYTLARLRAMEALLLQFSERDPEYARIAATDLHRVANGRKAFAGQYQGLLDPTVMRMKRDAEQAFVARMTTGSDRDAYGTAVRRIAEVQQTLRGFEKEHALAETGHAFASELFQIARHVVRLSAETVRPNAERLREYRESNLESLKFQLFSPAPIYPELERAKLQQSLTFLGETLGGDHPIVAQVLGGRSPARRASDLVGGTKVADPAVRRQLVAGGPKAVEQSDDPMIVFARLVDPQARRLRKRYEDEVEEPERQAYGELARIRFRALGRSVAPDATFTLRLAYGVVKGYADAGAQLLYCTTFAGLFDRAERMGYRPPFELPARWKGGRSKIDLTVPFNFVSTADTIGGNSGSPVLNRAGEFVGINFDRNRHGLVRNFVYTEEQARHIAVHSRGILEALDKLYGYQPLVAELSGTGGR